ncbi:MAG: CocE/NonD family hydrolase [Solirubrobacterales bacterium]
MRRTCMRCVGVAMLALAGLATADSARAAAPLGLTDCATTQGVYQCSGLVRTWDGVPLDTTITLPSPGVRNLPLVAEIHGFGNSKYEYLDPASTAYTDNAFAWARDGYAVLTYTARGLWGSCGQPEARLANPVACATGYIHLADVRYEARDTQTLIGKLVDEGVADPQALGVTGDSYGGGQSFELAALRDRVMHPDGRLVPWQSPNGTPLSIAAAAPVIPWTDLPYAAAPNGATLTYAITPPGVDSSPVGIEKATYVNAIAAAAQFATGPGQPVGQPFVPGRPMGYLVPPGLDPQADVISWVARTNAGEPYTDASAQAIIDLLNRFHSPYYVDPSVPPPPLFVASGFPDDLFPVDEAVRFANRTRAQYPGVPISMLFGDLGHQRAANKPAERSHLIDAIHAWFDHYLRGAGQQPPLGVTAYAQTCPQSAPSLGPFRARSFARLARGEVRFASSEPRTVSSLGGNPVVGRAIDPVSGGGDSCATVDASPEPGAAAYVLPTPHRAYTLIGAPAIVAQLKINGAAPGISQIAGRLWDVAPDGKQKLVARGLYRPTGGRNVWQLHPGAWRFARGHAAKLQLLGSDPPYARPSNGVFQIDVRRLRLALPVRQRPDCATVSPVSRPPLPPGQRLAPGVPRKKGSSCSKR